MWPWFSPSLAAFNTLRMSTSGFVDDVTFSHRGVTVTVPQPPRCNVVDGVRGIGSVLPPLVDGGR